MSTQATTVSAPKRKSRAALKLNGAAGQPQVPADIVAMAKAQADAQNAVRHALIEQAAYFLAQQRDFAPGHELDDWLGAEAEVDAKAIHLA
jgi:hypothetical protein